MLIWSWIESCVSHSQAKCCKVGMWPGMQCGLQCSCPLPCAITAVALHHRVAPGTHPSLSNSQTASALLTLSTETFSPLLSEEKKTSFTSQSCLIHIITFWQYTFVNAYQGWSTGRVKFPPKSLMNIEVPLPSNKAGVLVSQKQDKISH